MAIYKANLKIAFSAENLMDAKCRILDAKEAIREIPVREYRGKIVTTLVNNEVTTTCKCCGTKHSHKLSI